MRPGAILRLGVPAALLCLAAGTAAGTPQGDSRTTAFLHASVVPMDTERLLLDQTVVVSGSRILTMGPSTRTPVPPGAHRVDAHGLFLMPGLGDMHVHVYAPEELTLYAASGITSVFNLDGRPAHLLWRRRVASGELFGPAITTAGPTFRVPRSPEEAVREVDRQADAGYDAVKIYNEVSKAEYPALTAEAKRRHLLLVGHVAREPGFAATLAAGQSIAHAEEFVYTFFRDDPESGNEVVHPLDTTKIPRAVALTKEAGVSVIATLVAFHNIVRQATNLPAYLRNPELAFLPPFQRELLEPARNTYARRFAKELLPGLAVSYEFQRQLVLALHEGGVPVLAGTDASWLGVPGGSLIEEVENFQDAGFTPYAALRTATSDAAAMLRQEGEFGTLRAGKRADILVLRRNPLEDVRSLREMAGVVVAGRWVPETERRRMIDTLPKVYAAGMRRLEFLAESDPAALDAYLSANDPLGALSSALLRERIATGGAASVVAMLRRVRQANPDSPMTSEETINQLGYDLIGQKNGEDALAMFRLNTELYPSSGNAYDSLAETYLGLGDKARAREYYAKALEVQPDYVNAKGARAILDSELKGAAD
ncbi:MAG TPA: amidohydrolase family protein [Thermoanaerobaculia bacterium]